MEDKMLEKLSFKFQLQKMRVARLCPVILRSKKLQFKEPDLRKCTQKMHKKVERMSLEEYVIGAVAAEMPAEFSIEALKAQAIACRTYAARKISKKVLHKGYEKQKVYLCDDYSHCQAYIDINR